MLDLPRLDGVAPPKGKAASSTQVKPGKPPLGPR